MIKITDNYEKCITLDEVQSGTFFKRIVKIPVVKNVYGIKLDGLFVENHSHGVETCKCVVLESYDEGFVEKYYPKSCMVAPIENVNITFGINNC